MKAPMLFATLVSLAPVVWAKPPPGADPSSHHLQSAVISYDVVQYPSAVQALEAAYAADPTRKYLLINLAVTHQLMGDRAADVLDAPAAMREYLAAIDAYQHYLDRAATGEHRQKAEEGIGAARKKWMKLRDEAAQSAKAKEAAQVHSPPPAPAPQPQSAPSSTPPNAAGQHKLRLGLGWGAGTTGVAFGIVATALLVHGKGLSDEIDRRAQERVAVPPEFRTEEQSFKGAGHALIVLGVVLTVGGLAALTWMPDPLANRGIYILPTAGGAVVGGRF